jgi:hypothetical protein
MVGTSDLPWLNAPPLTSDYQGLRAAGAGGFSPKESGSLRRPGPTQNMLFSPAQLHAAALSARKRSTPLVKVGGNRFENAS